MSDFVITKTRIQEGAWEGIIHCVGEQVDKPDLVVSHLGQRLSDVSLAERPEAKGSWAVRIGIPTEILSDGVQTILIGNAATGETLSSFAIVTGEPLEDDIRAEIDLLRAELDMLKRAFRRHCVETL